MNNLVTYYTLEEFTNDYDYEIQPADYIISQAPGLTRFMNAIGFENTTNNKKILDMIMSNYGEYYAIIGKYNKDEIPTRKEVEKFWRKLLNVWNNVSNKYETILKLYSDNIDKLMNQVKATSQSKNLFNDTPQNKTDDISNFFNDNYATTLNKNETNTFTDAATPMARLGEIQEKYEHVMMNYLREFDKLFIFPDNVYDEPGGNFL